MSKSIKQSNWTLDLLKAQLSQRKEIKAWIITEEHVHRRERYFLSEQGALATDQDRNVHSRNISLRLFVHLQKDGRHGEITKKLFPSLPLQEQLEMAIQAALQTDHQSWSLPTSFPSSSEVPEVKMADPKIAEDINQVTQKLTEQIQTATQKKRASTFNSSELFLSIHDRGIHLSNGLTHRSSQSRIYLETAFSYSKSKANNSEDLTQSDEYLSTRWGVQLDQLMLDQLFDETAECAEKSLDTAKPESGKYSVIIDSDVLSTLLHGQIGQLTALNSYHGLPFIKPESEFIPNSEGDLLTVTLDPSLDFGASTHALSEYGLLQPALKLVDKNVVCATAADKQHADYLGISPTTSRGNIVIEAGTYSHQELTKQAPQVLEILQFSGLFADPNSGTFSSEIRLARLFDNQKGTVTYIKGGSLSGSITENFKNLRLSKNQVNRAHFSSDNAHGQGYYGPEHALLSNVSIVS